MSYRRIFHVVAILNYAYGIYYDQRYVTMPRELSPIKVAEGDKPFFKGRLAFLTIWNMLLQGLFFTVCVINDVVGTNEDTPKKPPVIRRLKDMILSTLAFPLSMFVGLTFWGLYFVDRELVFPKVLDKFFPVWLNHVMHTNIMIFILIEVFTSCRRYPSRKFGLTVLSAFMLVYLIWIHIIHAYSGAWVYPILEVLNFPLRLVFFISLLALVVILYVFGEKLNAVVWRKQIEKVQKRRV